MTKTISEMAKDFGKSRQAVAYQIKKMDLQPVETYKGRQYFSDKAYDELKDKYIGADLAVDRAGRQALKAAIPEDDWKGLDRLEKALDSLQKRVEDPDLLQQVADKITATIKTDADIAVAIGQVSMVMDISQEILGKVDELGDKIEKLNNSVVHMKRVNASALADLAAEKAVKKYLQTDKESDKRN